ncbi:hypothetical protein AFAEC_0579 [Aliarcobacter faecis]|uniref:hypothetical protein n=1 Tax=Aliarcobacter faecis TaxID=1564138 RepID=UPI00047A9999|nr:hypothetical protein [Aliarcobacter faecis]QKF72770.1 hypothetical protein AFAEC_0579 [Aliarcobacter faecis]
MRFNQSKFAKEVGCTQQNISKLIKKGILEVGVDKKLDLDSSLQRLRDFNLLDENNKLKNGGSFKTEKVEDKKDITLFEAMKDQPSRATETKEQKEQRELEEKEEQKALRELELKEQEARNKNLILDEDDDLTEYNYTKSKARREHYLSKIAEIDTKVKLGELVPKVEVEQTFFEEARKVRDMLLNLPNKMAMRVVGKKDIKEIELIINDEIRYILGNLSR